jgi:hypothetical protein
MYTSLRLNGEKTALIAVSAPKCAFMKRIKGGKVVTRAKWLTRIQWSVETAFGAFRNVPAERWKNLSIRTF